MKRLDELFFSLSAMGDQVVQAPPRTDLLLYAPCPVKLMVKERIEEIALNHAQQGEELVTHIPMGCTSIDPYDPISKEIDSDKLPSIIASIGFGDFWKRDFVERFLDAGLFGAVLPETVSPLHLEAGMVDPQGRYTLYGATPYVFLVDAKRLGHRPPPRTWADLLDPLYRGEVVMCGDGDDMADAVVLNIYKDFGMEGLSALAENSKGLMHSSTMVKVGGSADPTAGAVFVIPCFFAQTVKLPEHLSVVWPEDGAAASPLYFLAKKADHERLRAVIGFFTHEFARLGSACWFAPVDGDVASRLPENAKLKWVGWEFIRNNDVNALRDRLNAAFRTMVRERS